MNFSDKLGMEYKGTLYHFGDSFATSCEFEPIFTEHMAKELWMHWRGHGLPGGCNEQIFSEILNNLHKFKKDDLLIINWSYFSRVSYCKLGEDKIDSGNKLYPVNHDNNLSDGYRTHILDSALNMNYDNASKIFKSHMISLQTYFDKIGIKYVQTFLSNDLFFESTKIGNPYEVFKEIKNIINFDDGKLFYENWLDSIGWKNEECCHYTSGIQPELSRFFLEKYYNFYPK